MLLTILFAFTTLFIHTPNETIEVRAKTAITEEEKMRGLQGIDELALNEGMLFVYDEMGYYPFWMDETKIPLSLIFIDSEFKIISVKKGIPYSKKIISASKPYQYVLELNPKLLLKHPIRKGNTVSLEGKKPLSKLEKKS